ncbi:signal transduction histidine kinase, LytS [Hymenobacter roseosalivarius DSM 11622]|uniref:Signal transduction histidine kinase, LytS n=1 Tax=Hymenobacter roseosalivarius DSM 11622 TaxID=645990 RepID=A0A1W1W5N1_9BACT|nr:histidine kinase [Hymenobacter roseosalivarius]SMC00701.1 signal transduction histidine kinase, LytS [Hymenobacter roseosalivarius DSM 11622]
MSAARPRFFPEWPVHLLIWTLLLVKDAAAMYGAPTYPVPKTEVATYGLLGLGYLLINAAAFYLPVGLVARPLRTSALGWRPFGRAAMGLLLTLLLLTGMRYGLEFHVFKPLLGFDNYQLNNAFTAHWFVENSVRYYFDYVLYGLLYAIIRHNLLAERRRRETQQANTTAELTFLRSQLNPHFLFNTINDIYALVYQKSDAAPGALLKLSELLRYMLHEAHHDRVLLARELDYLDGLIELQRLGTKGNLHLDYQLRGVLNGQTIAPLLLVSFVENAFKHGVLNNPAQPVTLHLTLTATTLDFCLHNAKNEQQKDQLGGIGLTNVRRRLALLYPTRHTLTVADTVSDFQVTLHLDL